jgi:hypothetical protein
MTLEELLKNYGGNAGVSIDGYCEDSFNECLPDMKFWGKIKHRNVKTWNVIGAGNSPEGWGIYGWCKETIQRSQGTSYCMKFEDKLGNLKRMIK